MDLKAYDVAIELGEMIRTAGLAGTFDQQATYTKLVELITAPATEPVDALAQIVHAHRLISSTLAVRPRDEDSPEVWSLRLSVSLLWRAITTLEQLTGRSAAPFTGDMPSVSTAVGNA